MAKDILPIEDEVLSNDRPAPGAATDAARDVLFDRARKLRAIKYRMLFIFLLLPGLLVAAIVLDWIWELNLSGRMTHTYVLAIYGGLIAAFILIFGVIGYFIRKKMRREDEEMLRGPTPIEHPRPKPPVTHIRSRQ